MRKRLIAIVVLVSMFFGFIPGVPGQAKVSIETAVSTANEEIERKYGVADYYNISQVNRQVYNDYGVLVYGSPNTDKKNGEYRYLGTTPTGENFPNHRRDPDQSGITFFDDKNWIEDPWKDPAVRNAYSIRKSKYDPYRPASLENFKHGMSQYHADRYRYAANPQADTKPWDKYYHIVSPPTQHTSGLAWLWYKDSSNKLWYITVPLSAQSIVEPLDTVTIHYQDVDGNAIASKQDIKPVTTGVHTYHAKAIDHYIIQGIDQYTIMIQNNDTNHILTFTYQKNEPKDTVTIHYQDTTGTQISPTDHITPSSIGVKTFPAKDIDGYLIHGAVEQMVTIGKTGANHELTFTYRETQDPVPQVGYYFQGDYITDEGKTYYLEDGISSLNMPIKDLSKYRDADVENIRFYHNNSLVKEIDIKNHFATVSCGKGGHKFQIQFEDRRTGITYTDRVALFIDENSNNPDAQAPTAVITGGNQVRAGDYIPFNALRSSDPDGTIVDYNWYIQDGQVPPTNDVHVATWYEADAVGMNPILLTVMDNDGLTGDDYHAIEVLPPTIEGDMAHEGRLKVNRLLKLSSSFDAPTKYPVTSWLWNIGGTTTLDRNLYDTDLAETTPMFGTTSKEIYFLPKSPGQLQVSLTGSNGYDNDIIQKAYNIEPDLPPIVDFSLTDRVFYRNPYDDLQAEVIIDNLTHSPDGDYIQDFYILATHDANNDGIYDEAATEVYRGLSTDKIRFKVRELGHYKLTMYAVEGFDDTLTNILTEDDYLKGNTESKPLEECVIQIDNKAPIVGVRALKKTPVTIGVAYSNLMELAEVQDQVNSTLIPELEKNNIVPIVHYLPYINNTPMASFNFAIRYSYTDWRGDKSDFVRFGTGEGIGDSATYGAHWQSADGTMYVKDYIHTSWNSGDQSLRGLTFYEGDRDAVATFKFMDIRGYVHNTPIPNLPEVKDYELETDSIWVDEYSVEGKDWDEREDVEFLGTNPERTKFLLRVRLRVRYRQDTGEPTGYGGTKYRYTYRYPYIYLAYDLASRSYTQVTDITPYNTKTKDYLADYTKTYSFERSFGDWICVSTNQYGGCTSGFHPYIVDVTYNGTNVYHDYWDDYEANRAIDFIVPPREYPENDLITGKHQEVPWDENHNYFVTFQDLPLKHFHEEDLASNNKLYGTDFIGVGSYEGQAVLEDIVTKSDGNGVFMTDTGDREQIYENLAHYIRLDSFQPPTPVTYITLEDKVDIITDNLDYERDPITDKRWIIDHVDPDYFENGLGEMVGSGIPRDEAPEVFDKVGKYYINAQVKDEATTNKDFISYNKWSAEKPDSEKYTLYVHRRPIASFQLEAYGDYINITDKSYDIDHESQENKGIVEWKWQFFDKASSTWIEGKPQINQLTHGATYTLKLLVRDQEGAWSKPTLQEFTYNAYTKFPPKLEGELKTELNKFQLDRIPASEKLLAYDIISESYNNHYVQLGLLGENDSVSQFYSNSSYGYTLRSILGEVDIQEKEGFKYTWYEQLSTIPPTARDGDYTYYITAINPITNEKTERTFPVTVVTPVNLEAENLRGTRGRDMEVRATTSKYVDRAQVELFRHNSHSSGRIQMELVEEQGDTRYWRTAYTVPDTLPDDTYQARFEATTTNNNWGYAYKDIEIGGNEPPTVDIQGINPAVCYEGDTVMANISITDPDQDTLILTIYQQQIGHSEKEKLSTRELSPHGDGSYPMTSAALHLASPPGTYILEATVQDEAGETGTDTYSYTVHPLGITGIVRHVEQWNQNRIIYNRRRTGEDDDPRGYHTYWSGEKFILEATTTDILETSSVVATGVEVTILEEPQYQTTLTTTDQEHWSGYLWDESMIYRWGRAEAETLTFRFVVTYNNGTKKYDYATITIDDREPFFKYHRKF